MLLSFPYFQGLGCTVILQPLAIEPSNCGAFITINHLVALFASGRIESFSLIMELRKHPLMSYRVRLTGPLVGSGLAGNKMNAPEARSVSSRVSRYRIYRQMD